MMEGSYGKWLGNRFQGWNSGGPYHSSVSDQDHPQLTVVKWRDLCQMVGQCYDFSFHQ